MLPISARVALGLSLYLQESGASTEAEPTVAQSINANHVKVKDWVSMRNSDVCFLLSQQNMDIVMAYAGAFAT